MQPLAEAAIVFHPTGLAAVTAQLEAAAGKFDEGPAAGADHDPQIAWKDGLAETEDDWLCGTFWYEPLPSAKLPEMPDVAARTADLWTD